MKIIDDYTNEIDWRIKENANTSKSFSGLRSYISSSILARDSLNKLPLKIKEAHKSGQIHIHDLDGGIGIPYCYGADFQQLLFEGLKNPVGSCSLPAKHLDTVIDHIVNFIYISQSEFNGAQALSNFDTLIAPFCIGLSYDQIKQNMQRLIYNVSYPLRSAFQSPFFNTSFDLICPDHMKNEPILIGGKTHENLVYGDLQPQIDLINKAFLELMIDGDSQGKPFTFPILTYGLTKDILNRNNEIIDLIYKLSAKFGNPNFMNYISTGNNPADVRAMCCRLNLSLSDLKAAGLWNIGNKTGSKGVVTINLNQASINGYDHFIENIDEMYDLSVKELLIKNKYIDESFKKGLLPFTKQYLKNFDTFFNTIGTHAMNEACINMFSSPIEYNQDITIEMLKHLRSRLKETTQETGMLWNLEETPCEGATYRLAKLDRKLGLPTLGGEEPYLTNSTHCSVLNFNIHTIKVQERFKQLYNGGTILHGFVDGDNNTIMAKSIIEYLANETKIPYFNVTPTFSHCQNHGYQSGNVPICPKCGGQNHIYSRVVGYIRPIQSFNKGKQSEFKDRKTLKSSNIKDFDIKYDKNGDVICE